MDISTTSITNLRREHAIHNERVCDYLTEQPEFSDWVVTTAFYSALHWMHFHLFPRTVADGEGSLTINNFDEHKAWIHRNGYRQSYHMMLVDLVVVQCPSVSSKYRSLLDLCRHARYEDYKVGQKKAVKARNNLTAIRAFCENTVNQ